MNANGVKINCANSLTGTYYISDPCLNTSVEILGSLDSSQLVMYQTGTLLIEDFLTLVNFPDTVSLQIENNGYGANQCGDNVYQFTNQFSGSVVPFLSQDSSGNVYFAPTNNDADGIYPIRLYIAKSNYSNILGFYDFSVEITLD